MPRRGPLVWAATVGRLIYETLAEVQKGETDSRAGHRDLA